MPKDVSAVKKPLSSYMFFNEDMRPQVKKQHPTMGAKDILVELGKRWKTLTDAEKAPFEAKAEAAKKAYVAAGHGKPSKPTGENAPPKAASSAYIIFSSAKREEVKAAHPALDNKGLIVKLGEMWRHISDSEKKHFEGLAAVAKADAQKAKAAWVAKHGEVPKKTKKN